MLYFLFLLIYFVVNSYKVNMTYKYMGAQPPEIEIEHHRGETRGLYHRHTSEVSKEGEPPSSREREVGVVASLLLPHTLLRTLWPVHETRGAGLHMLGEVLWCLVQFGVTPSTKEHDPEVLPHVAIGGGGIFVHHPTVQAECYLLSQIFAIIEGHP